MMRCFTRRRCDVLVKRLFILIAICVCCSFVLNLVCFTGDCDPAESSNLVWASLGDVVVQADKVTDRTESQKHVYFPAEFVRETQSKMKKLIVEEKLKSMHLTSLDFCPEEDKFAKDTVLLAGRRDAVPTKRFLAVGIPSITRKSESYLMKTLTSIFNAVNSAEEHNITVVTFLADTDEHAKQAQLGNIITHFKQYTDKGMLQVIQAPTDNYVPLRDLHRSLGDNMGRVRWRSKQALDYSFLMCYCSYICKYYLQLEDDVLASPSFLSKIMDFVGSQKEKWLSLNVALLGYIGKLYPVDELQNLASYIWLFFNDMPVDWLEPRWKSFRGMDPSQTVRRSASLFQHIGLTSSFRPDESQRLNTLKERFFDQFDRKYRGLNPPAVITSDLVSRGGHPSDAYTRGDGYFWGRCGSAGSKVYDIMLKETAQLRRVVVETGANFAPRDTIIRGTLQLSRSVDSSNPKQCSNFVSLGEFRLGRIDVTCDEERIKCIRISIRYQGRWIYLREVNVWTG